jgi:hypothetical protein
MGADELFPAESGSGLTSATYGVPVAETLLVR